MNREYNEDGDYLMPVLNNAVIFSCTTGNTNQQPNLHESLRHGTFINKCQLPTCRDSCKQDTKHRNNTQTERNQPTQVAPKICTIMATILSLTIVLTLWRIWRNKNLLQTTIYTQTRHGKLRWHHLNDTHSAY